MAGFPRRWGDYVLIRPLGTGGMGAVYLALARLDGEEALCVIKRLTAEALADPACRERFRREGQISREFSCAALAKTIAIGEHDGEPFLAQEFVEGRTVAQLSAAAVSIGEPLSPCAVAQIGEGVGAALAYAHGRGVIHRDIAPGNVMVGFDGAVRVIDFGIARRPSDAALTATGEFIGRAAYSAPEVVAGYDADERSDVYSLGALLWELLVGRPAGFEELTRHPAPSSALPHGDVPPALDGIVVQALDDNPAGRFRSAKDVASALSLVTAALSETYADLSTTVGRCYDVSRERQRLASEMAESRRLLPGFPDGRRHMDPDVGAPRSRRSPFPLAAACLAGLVFGTGFVLHRSVSPEKTSSTVVIGGRGQDSPASQPGSASPVSLTGDPASAAPKAPDTSGAGAAHPKVTARTIRAMSGVRRPSSSSLEQAALVLDRARDSLRAADFDAAVEQARRAALIGTARQKSVAHLILGQVLLFRGKPHGAAAEFAIAAELDPANVAATDRLAELRRRGAP